MPCPSHGVLGTASVVVMTGDEGPRYRGGQAITDGKATEGYSSQGGGGSNSGEDDELYAIHLENRSEHSFP